MNQSKEGELERETDTEKEKKDIEGKERAFIGSLIIGCFASVSLSWKAQGLLFSCPPFE
jgi:hypothetical protein